LLIKGKIFHTFFDEGFKNEWNALSIAIAFLGNNFVIYSSIS